MPITRYKKLDKNVDALSINEERKKNRKKEKNKNTNKIFKTSKSAAAPLFWCDLRLDFDEVFFIFCLPQPILQIDRWRSSI